MTTTLAPIEGVERPARWLHAPLDADEIRRILPHTWPFLFLDRVTELKAPDRAAGLKNVTIAEPYFAGHFPRQAIMPGVLIVETLAQLGAVLLKADEEKPAEGEEPTGGYLAGVKSMRFRRPVGPGDQLRLRVWREHSTTTVVELRAEAKVGSNLVADGVLVLAV